MGNVHIRSLKVFAVAFIIYLDYKMVQQRDRWVVSTVKRSYLWENAHERNAKRLLNLIVNLKGLWVKLGQYLSSRADVLPETYICSLKQLQDSLPPRNLKEVYQTVKEELERPIDDVFSSFIQEPLATASIAQVHRATLKNGQPVVVKVQHKDIKATILKDLKNAELIVNWIAWAEPQYDFKPVLAEWCKEAPKELDFKLEAENTRQVADNLCRKNEIGDSSPQNCVNVLIPRVIEATEKVLILEYMDGIRVNDCRSLDAYDIDRKKLVEEITRAYAHQIYVDGLFNGDPHPGNFLVSKETPHRPILLDFGLTKAISNSMRQALAKMFLACAEGDQLSLLSSFAEMGLRLRLDAPDQAMEIINIFFRASTPAKEAFENMRYWANQRAKNMKVIQEKLKLGEKEMKRFNPIDAFPGDAVIFFRVINLLRGLSSTLDVHVVYLETMRPFAEAALQVPMIATPWICNSPAISNVESKVWELLLELGKENILGIQVCAYKNGKVIIDTAAGFLGKYDPRPVQPDTLFPVFSVTKGITAAVLHWAVDSGKVSFDDNISSFWPSFGKNGKDHIKVHHVLNHTAGLQNALINNIKDDPLLICNWNECLSHIATSTPDTEIGSQQSYHYLSFGWLCGGIIEHIYGTMFQEVLEKALVYPLHVEGEMYIGIPPGVESRLATISADAQDMAKLSMITSEVDLPYSFPQSGAAELVKVITDIPFVFNTLAVRRATVPAANGHCSARALARFYAALAAGGLIPPSHRSSKPSLGSHAHIPKFSLPMDEKRNRSCCGKKPGLTNAEKHHPLGNSRDLSQVQCSKICHKNSTDTGRSNAENCSENCRPNRIYNAPNIHDAFMGLGEYSHFVIQDGLFGLGFRRFRSLDGPLTCFGHSGIGGSTSFCDVKHDFAMAVTVNRMSSGQATRRIVQLVCSEVGVPLPEEFSAAGRRGPDMQL